MAKEARSKPNRKYNYRRGANFERRCKKALETEGYLVCRAAGSHGQFDLMAVVYAPPHPPRILLIQCKTDGKMSSQEEMDLYFLAGDYDCAPVLASRDGRKILWQLIERDSAGGTCFNEYEIAKERHDQAAG